MTNEKFQKDANEYFNLFKEVKEAEYRARTAQTSLESLKQRLQIHAAKMKEHVGKNLNKKCAVLPSEVVVIVEYVCETAGPLVRVFEDGLEKQ